MSNHPQDEQEWVLEFLPASRSVEPVREGGAGRPFSLPLPLRRMIISLPIVFVFLCILGFFYGPKLPKVLSYHSWHTLQYARLLDREIAQLDQAMVRAEELKTANPFEVQQAVAERLILLNRLRAEHEQSPSDYPQTKDIGATAIRSVANFLNVLAKKKNETALAQFNPDLVAADEANAKNALEVLRKQMLWMKDGAGL